MMQLCEPSHLFGKIRIYINLLIMIFEFVKLEAFYIQLCQFNPSIYQGLFHPTPYLHACVYCDRGVILRK